MGGNVKCVMRDVRDAPILSEARSKRPLWLSINLPANNYREDQAGY